MPDEPTTPDNKPTTPADPDVIEVCLVRAEKKVKVRGEDGEVRSYTLREMTGANRDRWMNQQTKRVKHDNAGRPVSVGVFDNIQADLIERCLYDEADKLVEAKVVAQWPATVQNTLFAACEKMNGLQKDKAAVEELAKNA